MEKIDQTIEKAYRRKAGLVKCPLTGEMLTDATVLEVTLLQAIRKKKTAFASQFIKPTVNPKEVKSLTDLRAAVG